MVAGHLREKSGYFYMVLSYKDAVGKRQTKTMKTGLTIKGNKKRAEAMLLEARKEFTAPTETDVSDEMLFSDYLKSWLEMMKHSLARITYANYRITMYASTIPYFAERQITLRELTAQDIQNYYQWEFDVRKVKANTVIHKHANIRKCLQHAFRLGLISCNPADRVERPKIQKFHGKVFSPAELENLFAVVKGTRIEFAVIAGAFYGLRRSEILGLKWNAIDFDNKTITIKHTVTEATIDGKKELIASEKTKTKSSYRTLPLIPRFEQLLEEMRAQQAEYKVVCGNCYCNDYTDYIYVNELGELIPPNYITQHFKIVLKNNGFDIIRFHDLRHSCASLLYSQGVSMREIQEWLGHSDIGTTSNIYTHLDYNTKVASANAIIGVFGNDEKQEQKLEKKKSPRSA